MSNDLSKKQKQLLREKLDKAKNGLESHAMMMIDLLENAGDKSNSLKLKQALLSFRVVYNRARLKFQK